MLTIPTIILFVWAGHTIEQHKTVAHETQEIHCGLGECTLTLTCRMNQTTDNGEVTYYLKSDSPCAQFWGYGH